MYTVIDIETTGGNYKTDKITEIAVFVSNGEKIIDEFVSLINPEVYIPPFITNITGITNGMVAGAPKFYEVAKKLVEITQNRVFVAHNVNFDFRFIQHEFKALGFHFQRNKLCTVELSRKYLPGHKSYSLGKLCDSLNIELNGRHRAGGDAAATVQLFHKILKIHQEQTPLLF